MPSLRKTDQTLWKVFQYTHLMLDYKVTVCTNIYRLYLFNLVVVFGFRRIVRTIFKIWQREIYIFI